MIDVLIVDVLIVDDSPTATFVLKHMLEHMGYTVDFVSDGAYVIDTAKELHPKVILMDLMMPELDGFKATRLLKKDDALKHIPVIFCSTKSEETDRDWAKLQGAVGFIRKPPNVEELSQVLESVINKEEAHVVTL